MGTGGREPIIARPAKCFGSYVNPACFFEDEVGVTVATTATCPKDLLVEARIQVALENCSVSDLDLGNLTTSLLLNYITMVPACAISTSVLGITDRRHLLQLPAYPAFYAIVVRVYVGTKEEGEFLMDRLQSIPFGAYLGEWLNANVAAMALVVDSQAILQLLSSATSDPHFTTASGDKFDFSGVAGQSYCIVTDKQLQVNARFVGATASNTLASSSQPDTRTWMDQVAIMHGDDRILIDAAPPARTAFASSVGQLLVNKVC
eukprot:jgi/Mesvir1/12153/Mv00402-RA.1